MCLPHWMMNTHTAKLLQNSAVSRRRFTLALCAQHLQLRFKLAQFLDARLHMANMFIQKRIDRVAAFCGVSKPANNLRISLWVISSERQFRIKRSRSIYAAL